MLLAPMAKRVSVVLNEDVLSLGRNGDLVEVAPGYARNFLLPQGKALPVTTRLLFKSRFAIITPDAPGLNISRRIKDEAMRDDLATLAEAGMNCMPTLRRDGFIHFLMRLLA